MNTLRQQYQQKIRPALQKELHLDNLLAVPRLVKITLNSSSRDFGHEAEFLKKTSDVLATITGQKPKITRARQSIAGFTLREGDIIGLSVTLRGNRMYDFFQRLTSIVLPRTKDFQGVKLTSFDQSGNYTLGLPEQIIFPEIEYDRIGRIQGLEITITTSAKDREGAHRLLAALGMPFAKQK